MIESKVVPIDSIRPNTWNPNSMKDSVFKFLKKSIKKRGFLQAIIITKDGVIIDGEHRYKALKELGESEVEVKVLDISDEEAKAETLNFNLTKGTFDVNKMGELLLELDQSWGKELLKDSVVMEQRQIDAAIRAYQKCPESDTSVDSSLPTLPSDAPSIQHGDVFYIGNHTLMCGDSTSADDVARLISGNEIDFSINDPPYNVNYEYNEHKDDLDEQSYEQFILAFMENASVAPFVAVTTGNRNEKYYYRNFETVGTAYWYKGFALTPGTICHAMVTEPILFFGEKPKGKMLNTDHLDFHTDRETGLLEAHSCPKPVALFKEIILAFTDVGGSVMDLFAGSGTTLIACDSCNRIAYLMEKDPTYCQSILDRATKLGLTVEKIDNS